MADQTTPTEAPPLASGTPQYGASYFANYWGGGGPYERNERWLEFFGGVADGIVRDLHPTKVLDAGCALGLLVEELVKRGVDARGIDISEYAIESVHESVRDRCRVASLTEPLADRYDLITCIEVVEHVPPEETDRAIANLCAATDQLLLSTTPQDYGEPTHLRVQPPEAWSAALAREGFYRDLERDFSYLSPWAALYTRLEEPVAETVRRYDRAWWRLRREVGEVRGSLLATQEKLSEATSTERIEGRPELLGELDRREEEVLRLRDLLVGKDLELGALRGHCTALERRAHRFNSIAARIHASIPGSTRLAGWLGWLKRRRG